MDIFARLLLAHLLADFTLQTNGIARWKRRSFFGVLAHASVFLVLALALNRERLGEPWFRFPGWVCVLILFATHVVQDEHRAYNVRHSRRNDSFLLFLADQFYHIALLFIFSPVDMPPEPLILYLILLVTGTHVLSVFILYLESAVAGVHNALLNFQAKYRYLLLRLLALAAMLLPGPWPWMALLTVPATFVIRRRNGGLTVPGVVLHLAGTAALSIGFAALRAVS